MKNEDAACLKMAGGIFLLSGFFSSLTKGFDDCQPHTSNGGRVLAGDKIIVTHGNGF